MLFTSSRAQFVNFSLTNWPVITYFSLPLVCVRQLQWFGQRQPLNGVLQHAILGEEVEYQNKISEGVGAVVCSLGWTQSA